MSDWQEISWTCWGLLHRWLISSFVPCRQSRSWLVCALEPARALCSARSSEGLTPGQRQTNTSRACKISAGLKLFYSNTRSFFNYYLFPPPWNKTGACFLPLWWLVEFGLRPACYGGYKPRSLRFASLLQLMCRGAGLSASSRSCFGRGQMSPGHFSRWTLPWSCTLVNSAGGKPWSAQQDVFLELWTVLRETRGLRGRDSLYKATKIFLLIRRLKWSLFYSKKCAFIALWSVAATLCRRWTRV